MSGPHPLNQAVLAQVLHDLRNGQLRRCQAMGFEAPELEALKHPTLVSLMANASVSWCSVQVNREVLQRLLRHGQDIATEVAQIDRMLRLGASSEMLTRFHGLTHQEIALRREVLGLPKRRGRHRELSEAQDAALWRDWNDGLAEGSIDPNDETATLQLAMDLAERHAVPVAVVWSAMRQWQSRGPI